MRFLSSFVIVLFRLSLQMMAVLESTQVLQDSKKPHNSAGDVTSSSERNDENVPGKEVGIVIFPY